MSSSNTLFFRRLAVAVALTSTLAACTPSTDGTDTTDPDDTTSGGVDDPDQVEDTDVIIYRVDAGSPQEADERDTVTLSGTTLPEADASVRWRQLGGPALSLTDGDTLTASFEAPAVGVDTLLVFALERLVDSEVVAVDDTSVLVRTTNLPPLADAGADREEDEQTAVTLTGTASDPDGTVAATSWVQRAGPTVTLTDADTLSPSLDTPAVTAPTTLVFRLDVTDDDGATTSDEMAITVSPVNAGPVVSAGDDQQVDESTTVTLAGSASDPDGTLASVRWTQVTGPAVVLDDPTDPTTTFTAPDVGQTTLVGLRLEASDDEGATASDLAWITVLSTNTPPTADAGFDQDVFEDDVVDLTGAASDPDGTVTAVLWTQIAGPTAPPDDPTSLATSVTAPAVVRVETLVYRLTVTDDEGATAIDDVAIRVAPDNLPPVADAGPDQASDEGTTVALSGQATDPDGAVATVAWVQRSGPTITLTDADTLTPTFTAPGVTTTTAIVLRLTVTDDEGATASDEVVVTVRPENDPPVVSAGADQIVDESSTATLAGSASDPDGSIASTVWTQVAGPVVALSDPTALAPTFDTPATTDTVMLGFELAAVDDEGARAADLVWIWVTDTNAPPLADAGPDLDVLEGTPVRLEGTAGDADGQVASIQWTQIAGPLTALDDPASEDPGFTAPMLTLAQTLVYRMTVTDDEGASASDDVAITVRPVNLPPLVSAGDDAVVDEGDGAVLSGAATDPDGSIATTLWTQIAGPQVLLGTPTDLATAFTAPDVAQTTLLGFRFEAVDDESARASDLVWVTVISTNLAPLADAGADQTVLEGTTVQLAGTASDPDGTVTDIAWTQIAGPTALLTDSTVEDPQFAAPNLSRVETLVYRITVTDDEGATAFDDVAIRVAPDNLPPLASAGDDQDVIEGTLVQLDGTAVDPDGSIASVAWTQIAGPGAGLSDPAAEDPTFTAPAVTRVESVVFRLTVTDDEGATDRDDVLVRITPSNLPPTAQAGPNQTVTSGDTVQLDGTASDPDGTVVATTWRELGTTDWSLSDPGVLDPTTTAPDVTYPETWVFELEVVDDEGAITTDTMSITVQPLVPVNRAPTVFAGTDQEAGSAATVQLQGAASDPDGTVVSTTWTQVSGPTVSLADPSQLATSFGAPDLTCAALLVFELEAVDDDQAVSTDRTSVLVTGSGTTAATAMPAIFDLDGDDGAFVTEGSTWQYGVPTRGPSTAWSGTRVWATNLGGNYGSNLTEVLCLPPIDLTGATDPLLTFRAFMRISNGDGVVVEGLDPNQGWVPLTDTTPAMTRVAAGAPSFSSTGTTSTWWLHAVRLPSWLGTTARIRVVLRSDNPWVDLGAYLDDLRIEEDSTDPDGDGISGILHEWLTLGLDPYVGDVDGDGTSDGDELAAGTDPDNPSDHPGRAVLTPGFVLDLEADDGGLVAGPGSWAHGAPASGPGHAASGASVWATNLSGAYGVYERSYLYLPPIDLTVTPNPVLTAKMWSAISSGDGLSVESWDDDDEVWRPVTPHLPAYESTDAIGHQAWRTYRYRTEYRPIAVPLDPLAGGVTWLRFAFRTDGAWADAGAYLDDIGVHDESEDPDGDGVGGILAELDAGTDPFDADSDDDGATDGAEDSAGTDPLDPAWYPGSPTLVPGTYIDFEGSTGGLVSTAADWSHGVFASGPGQGWSGTQGWATNPSGAFAADARAFLHLPTIDLTSVSSDATLSLRMWSTLSSGDGVSLEVWSDTTGWATLNPAVPPYDNTDALGHPAWRSQTWRGRYVWAAVSLAPWAGEVVRLRLAFRSDSAWSGAGFYLDDLALDLESSDPDGDGLTGILAEYTTWGTDPYVADGDLDGATDGAEIAAGTLPDNPAHHPAATAMTPGDLLDFELDPGGCVADGSTWQHGNPASGPGVAWSGSRVWATTLAGNYPSSVTDAVWLPPVDLTTATRPTLSLRLWMSGSTGDGFGLDVRDASGAWSRVLADEPVPYTSTDASGVTSFRTLTDDGDYALVTFDLSAWQGQEVALRLMFRSDGSWVGAGAYVDDIRLDVESADPDGDGLLGIADERVAWGTDPFLADTDGDGFDDDVEIAAASDPLDPASTP